jgi:LacI family transcriptional regulator
VSDDEAETVVTLADVARHAGVNASTASRALRQPGRVNPETAERIREVADRLGYVPPSERTHVRRAHRSRRRVDAVPTIYDVAELAGVNPSTVSRALNMPGRISAATQERVLDAANRLNYRTNPAARALLTGRTSTLGIVVADITNPVFFPIARGAEREAAEHGYTLVIAESQESRQVEAETVERLMRSTDALILGMTRLSDAQIQQLAGQKPLALVNRHLAGVTSVVPELGPGIDEALAHLAGLGHSTVAYLSGPRESWMSFARWKVIEARAAQRGLAVKIIESGDPTVEGGRRALPKVIASGVTAVLAYNDLQAIGLLTATREADWEVPGRLSVVGFDDIFGADFTSPPLTTVRTPLAQLGALAVRRVLGLLDNREVDAEDQRRPLVTELVLRGSTGRIGTP